VGCTHVTGQPQIPSLSPLHGLPVHVSSSDHRPILGSIGTGSRPLQTRGARAHDRTGGALGQDAWPYLTTNRPPLQLQPSRRLVLEARRISQPGSVALAQGDLSHESVRISIDQRAHLTCPTNGTREAGPPLRDALSTTGRIAIAAGWLYHSTSRATRCGWIVCNPVLGHVGVQVRGSNPQGYVEANTDCRPSDAD
jgi:hypothetical protein